MCEEIRIKEIIKDEKAYCVWDDAQTDRIDIKAKDKKGDDIVIRIQNMRKLYYLERIRFGTPAFAKHIYQEVNKVYLVGILYFDLGKGNDYLYHGQNRFIGVHTNDELLITVLLIRIQQRPAYLKRGKSFVIMICRQKNGMNMTNMSMPS